MSLKKRIFIILFTIILAVGLLAGCAKKEPTNLEEYIRINQSEQDAISGIASNDPNATITVNENTMEILYVVEDPTITAEALNTVLDGLDESFAEVINDLENETGLQGISIRISYVDANKKEITGKLYQ